MGKNNIAIIYMIKNFIGQGIIKITDFLGLGLDIFISSINVFWG